MGKSSKILKAKSWHQPIDTWKKWAMTNISCLYDVSSRIPNTNEWIHLIVQDSTPLMTLA